MSKQFETGHAKNLANLLQYNQFLTTLGAAYNPAIPAIGMVGMDALYIAAKGQLDAAKQAEDAWKTKTNSREIAFNGLGNFCTRLLGVLRSTGAQQQTLDDMAALVAKIRGKSKKTKATKPIGEATTDARPVITEPANTHSTSQLSYDLRLDNFSKMVLLLEGITNYTPNEPNLAITGLQNHLTLLTNLNTEATAASVNLKTVRTERNAFFYAPETGVLTLVKRSKDYLLGLYGRSSPQYKTAISFKFVQTKQ